MPKKICENCGIEYQAKTSRSRFHSDACRVEAARKEVPAPVADLSTAGETNGTPDTKVNPDAKHPVGATANQVGGVHTDLKGVYDRAANLKAFEAMGMERVNWISTGIEELDNFQMIPRGRITQIQGPFAVGKTTLCLNMIRGLRNKKVFYIDSEAALNPHLLVDLGLTAKNFKFWNKTAFIEDIYDEVVQAADSGKYEMIILDSLAACTTRVEVEGHSTASNIGQKAKIVNKLMRVVPMKLKDSDTALVVINQERDVIGSYVPQKYTPGGMGPIYAASLILGLKTIPSWRFPKGAKDGEFEGHEIEVKIIKSKVSRPHRTAKIKLFYVNEELADKYPLTRHEGMSEMEPFDA